MLDDDRPYNGQVPDVLFLPEKLALMKNLPLEIAQNRRRNVLVAMVLGTALSAIGPSAVQASPETVGDISRYCTACWRNARLPADTWIDCTQDVFVRLLERVAPDTWDRVLRDDGDERREFLRAIDAVKKRTQRGRKWAPLTSDAVADRTLAPERERVDERQAINQAATELLSPRQQRILQLSFEGWSVQDMAAELHTTAERVSDEKYKAVRKLRAHLCAGLEE
jgi:RNA polymerase sigma factor (sigma-70 family)